jgi:hypothetical protein
MFAKMMMLAAALVTTSAALAETHSPEAYEKLTAAPQKPGQAPRLIHGVSDLSARESRHQERLPLQLNGAVEKIKRAKYAPKRIQPTAAPKREAKAKRAKAVRVARKSSNSFEVQAVVAPAKRGKSKTHPVGFTESLPMPSAAPVASDSASGF